MGLIHWLPLNGNLDDIGLNSVAVTNEGATIDNSGKIGKCYSFNDYHTITLGSIDVGDEFSVCYWVYYNDLSYPRTHVGIRHSDGAYVGTNKGWDIAHGNGTYNFDIDDGTDWQRISFSPDGLNDLNVWKHFTLTCSLSARTVKLYINGTLVDSASIYSTLGSFKTSHPLTIGQLYGWYFNGKLNDFRIYDHVLSAKEVKEISKGLVLHYNFEDPYIEGTTNLSDQSGWITYWDNSGTSTHTTNDTSLDSPVDAPVYSITQTTAGQSAFGMGPSSSSLPSQTITVSVWFYRSGPAGTDAIGPFIRDLDTDAWLSMFTYNGSDNYKEWPSNTWLYLSKTITTDSNTGRPYICCYTGGQGEKFAFTGWQIEQKDHATPYVNGTRQTGIVYDNSGYGYNGTPSSDFEISSDSACGRYSSVYNSASIISSDLNLSGNEPITFSCWTKLLTPVSYQPVFWLGDGASSHGFCVHGSGANRLEGGNGSTYFDDYGVSSTALSYNEWTHLVHIWDGSTIKRYVNGVFEKSLSWTAGFGDTFQKLYLGTFWGPSASLKLSDFKIYTTALSEDDILLEYNRKASIDRDGNLFTSEFIEEDTPNIKITKNSIVKSNNLIEKTRKLPEDYTELEYIESTGTQWIDTGLGPSTDISFDIRISDFGDSSYLLTQGNYGLRTNGSIFNFVTGKNIRVDGSVVSNHIYSIQGSNDYLVVDGVNGYNSSDNDNPSGTLKLLSYFGSRGYAGKVYSLKVYDDGKLVRYFIPAKRKSDNVVSLYDVVNCVFYPNAGSGDFVGGPEKNRGTVKLAKTTNGYTAIEYLESSGTQYIDTGIKFTDNITKIETQFIKISEAGASGILFGGYGGAPNLFYFEYSESGQSSYRAAYGYSPYPIAWLDTGVSNTPGILRTHIFTKNGTSLRYNVDGTTATATSTAIFDSTQTHYLFAYNEAGTAGYYYKCKMYYFKIWVDDKLVRDFVPAKIKSDNKLGLYDKISGNFYINSGSGTFTAGPEVDSLNTIYAKEIKEI